MKKFIEIYETSKPDVHRVQTIRKKELLGYIKYDEDWKCYVFEPDRDTKFNWSCQLDIMEYTHKLDMKRGLP
jgi:uncharacterized protein (DUF2147 family)